MDSKEVPLDLDSADQEDLRDQFEGSAFLIRYLMNPTNIGDGFTWRNPYEQPAGYRIVIGRHQSGRVAIKFSHTWLNGLPHVTFELTVFDMRLPDGRATAKISGFVMSKTDLVHPRIEGSDGIGRMLGNDLQRRIGVLNAVLYAVKDLVGITAGDDPQPLAEAINKLLAERKPSP